MQKLSEYLKEKMPGVSLVGVKAIIKIVDQWERDMRGQYCDICYKELTEEQSQRHFMKDFNFCCDEHYEHRMVLDLENLRRELGINIENRWMYDI